MMSRISRKRRRSRMDSGCGEVANSDDDIISSLPDGIIQHVLSFLPTISAVRTSILSTKWRYTWTATPAIDIHLCDSKEYLDDENHQMWVPFSRDLFELLMLLGNGCNIEKIHVSCWFDYDHYASTLVTSWISTMLMRHKVRDFKLVINLENFTFFPQSFFTCESLTTADIGMATVQFPSLVCMPNLRNLILRCDVLSCHGPAQEVLFTFPNLEDFHLECCKWENVKTVNICAPNLKRLFVEDEENFEDYEIPENDENDYEDYESSECDEISDDFEDDENNSENFQDDESIEGCEDDESFEDFKDDENNSSEDKNNYEDSEEDESSEDSEQDNILDDDKNYKGCEINVDAESLLSFEYVGKLEHEYSLLNSFSLVDAHVVYDSHSREGRWEHAVIKLLTGISTVQYLTVGGETITILSKAVRSLHLLTFLNLTMVELHAPNSMAFQDFVTFLRMLPNLECLSLTHGVHYLFNRKDDGIRTTMLPCCLSHLKAIVICTFDGDEYEIFLIKLFLKNAEDLDSMIIRPSVSLLADAKKRVEVTKKLLRLPRGSASCVIDFPWKYKHDY